MRIWSLTGVTPYAEVHALQRELVELRAEDQIPDTVLMLEHEPTITRGRGLQFTGEARVKQVPLGPLPANYAYVEIERGGDLTAHEPGQLVVYPILKLDGRGATPARDIGAYLRWFESVLISALQSWGLEGRSVPDATGVWVGERKVASLGVAARKWVTYHGIAINAVNTLEGFSHITPCGFSPEVMTRLSDLIPEPLRSQWFEAGWREELECRLAERLDPTAPIEALSLAAALRRVRGEAEPPTVTLLSESAL